MKLSIITICFNNCAGLQATINSVISQVNVTDFEHIIVDGGSLDGSAELIFDYSCESHLFEVKCISEKDDGIYNAMNKGIDMAVGDYCMFLNSGDVFAHNRVLKKVMPMLADEDIVYGDVVKVKGNKKRKLEYKDVLSCYDFFSAYPAIHHQAAFIRRCLFDKIGKYREDMFIAADWFFFFTAVVVNHVSTKHISVVVSVCDMSGLSNSLRKDDPRFLYDTAIREQVIGDYCKNNNIQYYVPKDSKFCVYLTKFKWKFSVLVPLSFYIK